MTSGVDRGQRGQRPHEDGVILVRAMGADREDNLLGSWYPGAGGGHGARGDRGERAEGVDRRSAPGWTGGGRIVLAYLGQAGAVGAVWRPPGAARSW